MPSMKTMLPLFLLGASALAAPALGGHEGRDYDLHDGPKRGPPCVLFGVLFENAHETRQQLRDGHSGCKPNPDHILLDKLLTVCIEDDERKHHDHKNHGHYDHDGHGPQHEKVADIVELEVNDIEIVKRATLDDNRGLGRDADGEIMLSRNGDGDILELVIDREHGRDGQPRDGDDDHSYGKGGKYHQGHDKDPYPSKYGKDEQYCPSKHGKEDNHGDKDHDEGHYPSKYGKDDQYPSKYGKEDHHLDKDHDEGHYPSKYGKDDQYYHSKHGKEDNHWDKDHDEVPYPSKYGKDDQYPSKHGNEDKYWDKDHYSSKHGEEGKYWDKGTGSWIYKKDGKCWEWKDGSWIPIDVNIVTVENDDGRRGDRDVLGNLITVY